VVVGIVCLSVTTQLGFMMSDKKSFFGQQRPTRAETMPEPILSSECMAWSVPKARASVQITTKQRLCHFTSRLKLSL
jgi:hypothetical protein